MTDAPNPSPDPSVNPPDAPQTPQGQPQPPSQPPSQPSIAPGTAGAASAAVAADAARPAAPLKPEDRTYLEALNTVFDRFALKDQLSFYRNANARNAAAARQVNKIRASLALLTGLSAALAGLLVQTTLPVGADQKCFAADVSGAGVPFFGMTLSCGVLQAVIIISLVATVVMPAFAAAFNILSDLYQWDRLLVFYEQAIEKATVADALSPVPEMDDRVYAAALRAFSEGTLGVMADETAQWGQLIRTPPTIEQFLREADERAAHYDGRDATPKTFFGEPKQTTASGGTGGSGSGGPPAPAG